MRSRPRGATFLLGSRRCNVAARSRRPFAIRPHRVPRDLTLVTPGYDIADWRSRIPLLAHAIPMNNCSQAPQTEATRAAADAYLESWARDGMDWEAWVTEVERARESFARLINADVDEVAVTSSVSQATSALASALRFDERRHGVVASAAEFPTVGHVWLAQGPRGADVDWVPLSADGTIELADYARRIDDRTRVVSACHAYFANGFKQDVAAIARAAHEHGALLFVDAYQTLGTEPIDVKALDVDALAGGTLKYLMACAGVAFLYVRRDLADQLRPTVTGWFGRLNPFAFDPTTLDWAPSARRFDG